MVEHITEYPIAYSAASVSRKVRFAKRTVHVGSGPCGAGSDAQNQSDPARKLLLAGSDVIAVVLFLLAGSLRGTGGTGCFRGSGNAGSLRNARGAGGLRSAGGAGHAGGRRCLRSAIRALVCRRIDLRPALGALNGAGFDSGWSEAHIGSFLSHTTVSLCSQHLHRVFESSISAQTMHRLLHARCHAVAGKPIPNRSNCALFSQRKRYSTSHNLLDTAPDSSD